jgi:pimeloyl-ACP methyl ester carboxylesterase
MARPALLLIHGLAGSLDYFGPAARIRHAQVHALDLLGYGQLRDVSDAQLTLKAQAEHVAAHLEAQCRAPAWLLGHSLGGGVAMLAADRRPELVRGIINVEGNFTLADAFWSRKIVAGSADEWAEEYRRLRQDVPATVADWHIEPSPRRTEWLAQILDHQPPGTIYAMSKATLAETGDPAYLAMLHRVVERDLPLHLVAGARSAAAWDVPEFVRAAARSYTEIADAGHLMMLERPAAFCRVVDAILAAA